jgi:hypothetical protein
MCDECEEFPAQYVAYFNKAGGKLWRPAQKAMTRPWAIDIRPAEPPPLLAGESLNSTPIPLAGEGRVGAAVREVRQFTCDEPPAPPAREGVV